MTLFGILLGASLAINLYLLVEKIKKDKQYIALQAKNLCAHRTEASVQSTERTFLSEDGLQELLVIVEQPNAIEDLMRVYYEEVEYPLMQAVSDLGFGASGDMYLSFTLGPDREIVRETAQEVTVLCTQWKKCHPNYTKRDLPSLVSSLRRIIATSRTKSNLAFGKWVNDWEKREVRAQTNQLLKQAKDLLSRNVPQGQLDKPE